MRRTDPSNKNRPEGNTNTLPPPTYTRIYPRSSDLLQSRRLPVGGINDSGRSIVRTL